MIILPGKIGSSGCYAFASSSGVGGRGMRNLFQRWYDGLDPVHLLRVRSRDGVSHKDIVRLLHVKGKTLGARVTLTYLLYGIDKARQQYKEEQGVGDHLGRKEGRRVRNRIGLGIEDFQSVEYG